MDCVFILLNLNFNVVEDIVQSKDIGQVEQDSREVQSDKD